MPENSTVSPAFQKNKLKLWVILIPVCLIGICIISLVLYFRVDLKIGGGGYSIDKVVLSKQVDENYDPVNPTDVFAQSDRIICTVMTTGVDGGIIGMKWYSGNQLIYEYFGKTKEHKISTFIQSSSSYALKAGEYRVDIHISTDNEAIQSVPFIISGD